MNTRPLLPVLFAALACSEPTVSEPDPTLTSASTRRLTLEAVTSTPLPGLAIPVGFAFTADDKHVTFLAAPPDSLTRELFAVEVQTGLRTKIAAAPGGGVSEEKLSPEEQLRRERSRSRALGIPEYTWSKPGNRFLVPLLGDAWIQDGLTGTLTPLIGGDGPPVLDPRFSPDGEHVAYVRDNELWVNDIASRQGHAITQGANATRVTHGLAEYVAQEEMNRHRGYWWSPDSRRLAYTQVDEKHLPVFPIVHQGGDEPGGGRIEEHRYPFAGGPNAHVQLAIAPREGGKTVWVPLDLGWGLDFYLARVDWFPGGDLAVQLQNRAQSELVLLRVDPDRGTSTELLREKSEIWINLHDMFRPLEREVDGVSGAFLWATEASGFRHLELRGPDGRQIRSLTSGEWQVDDIVAVDETAGRVWFAGTRDDVTERQIYSVDFSGGEPKRLTKEPGEHSVVIDHGFQRYIDVHDSIDQPPRVTLRSLSDGSELQVLHDLADPRIAELGLTPPELSSFSTPDGTVLRAAVFRPDPARWGEGPFPTLISVYGGPHAQRVAHGWELTADLRAQALRERGYLVARIDNRGSARRGLAFEGAIRHALGKVEIDDQVAGIQWLVGRGLTDPARVGIYGWSYGGYMSAMALARAPEVFKIGIAGAPVTHWDGYDTHYTERYMGMPSTNAAGYETSSVMHHVAGMKGRLLLIHGLVDENVHFRHTARLIQAMIEADKNYELLLLPTSRHGPRSKADRHRVESEIDAFITAHL